MIWQVAGQESAAIPSYATKPLSTDHGGMSKFVTKLKI